MNPTASSLQDIQDIITEDYITRAMASDGHLTKVAVEFMRQCALSNPWYFISSILGYHLEEFHKRWFAHQDTYKKTVLLAPRGHGKSTICDVSFILWRIIHNSNIRILIASKTTRQAVLFLSEVRQHIERNSRFRDIFGDWVSREEWNVAQVRLPRDRIMKEPTITAIGIGSSLPSWHFDMIIADDLHDLANSRTPGQREAVWRWFEGTMLPTLEPHGELHVLGTRWHADDVYGRLIAKSAEAKAAGQSSGAYEVLVEKAIISEGPTPDQCQVLWPDYMPYEKLVGIRHEQGPAIFSLQYQCSAEGASLEGAVFNHADFRILTEDTQKARKQCVYVAQGWDLATEGKDLKGEVVGEEIRTNYTACVTVGLTKDNEFIVLDWYRGRPGLIGQVEEVQAQAAKWDPDVVVMESVAYQNILTQYMRKSTGLPIVPVIPQRDKVARAWRLQPYVEEKRVLIPLAHIGLRDILSSFPLGEEDDSVDAWMHAMDRVVMFARGKQTGLIRKGLGQQRRGM